MSGPFAKFTGPSGLEMALHYAGILAIAELPAGAGVTITVRTGNTVTNIPALGTLADALAKVAKARKDDINSFDEE